jgi:hypothetical protein
VSQDFSRKKTHVVPEQGGATGPIGSIHNRFKGNVARQGVGGGRSSSRAGSAINSSLVKDGKDPSFNGTLSSRPEGGCRGQEKAHATSGTLSAEQVLVEQSDRAKALVVISLEDDKGILMAWPILLSTKRGLEDSRIGTSLQVARGDTK